MNYASLVGLPKQTDALKWKAAVALKLECLQKCPRDHKSLVYRPQPDPLAAAGNMGPSYGSDARSQGQLDDISGVYHKAQWYGQFSLENTQNHCWLLRPRELSWGHSVWEICHWFNTKGRTWQKWSVYQNNRSELCAREPICQLRKVTEWQHMITYCLWKDILGRVVGACSEMTLFTADMLCWAIIKLTDPCTFLMVTCKRWLMVGIFHC